MLARLLRRLDLLVDFLVYRYTCRNLPCPRWVWNWHFDRYMVPHLSTDYSDDYHG